MRLKLLFGREAWKTLSHQTQTEVVKNSLKAKCDGEARLSQLEETPPAASVV